MNELKLSSIKNMTEEKINNKSLKEMVRCSECDREMEHFNEFVSPTNEKTIICWECVQRGEKGFNTKRDFSRNSRRGIIPR